ncbi:urea carboxylase-associated family protein [Burkholderia sp. MR1-5-21]
MSIRLSGQSIEPVDSNKKKSVPKQTVYENGQIQRADMSFYNHVRSNAKKERELIVPARDGLAWDVPAGHLFRIVCVEGSQVGDLNLWNADNLEEKFYSGKTRAIHATHVTTGDRLWSSMPFLRPMATVTHDTLNWYGYDEDGCAPHDVIGTRCDPYIHKLLDGIEFHKSCHSNLVRGLAKYKEFEVVEAEKYIHDVLNVFMCSGFDKVTHEYINKASPVRAGDFIEFFAEINLLACLSACPAGDCGLRDERVPRPTYPLKIEIFKPDSESLADWTSPKVSDYSRSHGM